MKPQLRSANRRLIRVWAFDGDPAGGDAIEEAFEFLGTTADAGHERLRAVHMTKSDLER